MEKICYCCSCKIDSEEDIIEDEEGNIFCSPECQNEYYSETNDGLENDIKYDEQKEKEMLKI